MQSTKHHLSLSLALDLSFDPSLYSSLGSRLYYYICVHKSRSENNRSNRRQLQASIQCSISQRSSRCPMPYGTQRGARALDRSIAQIVHTHVFNSASCLYSSAALQSFFLFIVTETFFNRAKRSVCVSVRRLPTVFMCRPFDDMIAITNGCRVCCLSLPRLILEF